MSVKTSYLKAMAAAVMLFGLCGTAHAGLIGDEFQMTDNFGDPLQTGFVSPVADFIIAGGAANAIVGDDTLTLNNSGCGGQCSVVGADGILLFTDLSHAAIASVTIASINNITGFSAADIAFTANSITLTLPSGMDFETADSDLVLDVTTVPEPASLAMLGSGLLLSGFFLWRRRKPNSGRFSA